MVNTSDRPIVVDGVRLDTLGWNIEKINRATAARRDASSVVPGRDGVIPSLNDSLEPATFGLEMFVQGTDADGAIPVAGKRDTFWANLDELIHLFGKRHALLDLRETVAPGVERRAWAKVTDAITPDVNQAGGAGRFAVALELPYATWEDVNTQDWTSGVVTSGTAQEVTTLQGATERIQDAMVSVLGPITNPRLTDPATGAYVELQAVLAAGSSWRVNVGTWATRYGATVSLTTSDTTGTDGTSVTRYGGTLNQAAYLPLTPVRSAGLRKVTLALSGTGLTTATRFSVRARRKFAL